MASTSMRCIFVIFLAAVCCNCQSDNTGGSSSWAKLQISPDTLSSMKYGNFLIEIYEHANNHKPTATASQKKYFYSPIALLDNKSAVSSYNNVTKQPEMSFRIEMWNDKVENEVVKHLNDIVGHQIKSNQVRVIPLEKVILVSKRPTVDYSLYPEWTNYDKSKTLWFYLSCYDPKICDELANEMRSNPKQFHQLKLLYSLSSQTSQTKHTTISIESITSGTLVSTLLQKFEDKKEIFLTASDEKKMLSETATNIRMDTFDDSEVGSPDTEFQILNILKDLLVTSRTTIKEQSDKMWDSVFWNEDNYRPDKTTKTLNEILNKLDKETQKKLADMFQKAEKQAQITEKLISSNRDEERRREEQINRENQSKDANENEMKRSQATDQEQLSRNQTRDDESNTNNVDTKVTFSGYGVTAGAKVAVGISNTHNAERENEKSENAKKNTEEYDRKLENKERIQHNYDSNSWANADRISSAISGKLSNDSDSSRRVEILKEDVKKFLQESRNHVEWNGEKFVPKPMQLSRINLAKFRDSQSFQDRNIRVRYTNAELSAPIKIMEHAELIVVNEWNNLKDELKATTELLNITMNNLVKINSELSNVKSDLTNKLEGTKKELEKTKINLEETRTNVKNLSTQLNGTKKELGKTKIDLEETKSNVKNLSTQLNATEKQLAETKITAGNLSTELKETKQDLLKTRTDLTNKDDDLSTKIKEHELKVAEENLSTVKEIFYVLGITTNLSTTRTVVGQMPTSCADLERNGQKVNGFFLVKGSKKMETVYCNFYPNQTAKQKWIGYADVKSAPVHFYVQRKSHFKTKLTPIPFDLAVVNEGNAMNLTSGKFTAPRPGTYFFSFAGVAHLQSSSSSSSTVFFYCHLYLNGNLIGSSFVRENYGPVNQLSPLTVQLTLNLKKGDQVWMQIDYSGSSSTLYDSVNYYTHFTGFMLEEEIGASL
ncbi:synaptonemal complex protein 1-like isoform X2 [Daphnia pulicaria]|uniref:synaptonemal complex protein 1-like isoform X2 n=1 Tax=Daphnia pulicaria TaxID=35523 RepID=UPI001EEB198C|nr:synaptonemal complex protein 1-like isoform X2 [Daphnia pulicaria]